MTLLDPNRDTPRNVREFVTRIGHLNPYGEPLWRVVLAQNCLAQRAGVLHQLPTGEITCFAISADGKKVYEAPPDRITSGLMELPKYPCEGWIIEKWFSAATWGSPEEWAAHKSENGDRMMGEYPARGDYWLMAGPFEKIPELSDIENAIAMHVKALADRPENYVNFFAQTIKNEEQAREARRQKLERDLEQMRRSELVPVLRSGSLAAQRFRNELSESIGDRSHLGAVHNA
jgi:hypothetical protein